MQHISANNEDDCLVDGSPIRVTSSSGLTATQPTHCARRAVFSSPFLNLCIPESREYDSC
jgi:hypothetical protein